MHEDWIAYDDVVDLLIEWGELRGREPIPRFGTKPSHGICCTCQDCWYPHDECVCLHNELLERLQALKQDGGKWVTFHEDY